MSAHGVPVKEARCGKFMPKSQAYCAQPEGHGGSCRSAAALRAHYDRNRNRRERQVAENRARVDACKLELGCIDCGYDDNPVALDFDHIDQAAKTANVSAILWKRWPDVLAEIEKCLVRCANCHRIKTSYMHETLNSWHRAEPIETRRRPAASSADDGPATRLRTTPQVASATVHLAPPP
jgi:hypothetical protein